MGKALAWMITAVAALVITAIVYLRINCVNARAPGIPQHPMNHNPPIGGNLYNHPMLQANNPGQRAPAVARIDVANVARAAAPNIVIAALPNSPPPSHRSFDSDEPHSPEGDHALRRR